MNAVEGKQTTVFELKVAQPYLEKVIGREGRKASSIHSILVAAGKKFRKRFVHEIL